MHRIPIQMLTICGISELTDQRERSVTHVLSILDPDHPDPEAFGAYDPHHRTILRFHDIIHPIPGMILPQAWPNSLMVDFADEFLSRKGRLTDALRRHYGRQIQRMPNYVQFMRDLGRGREVEMAA